MPNDLPLLPPKNQAKHLDKSMISLPSDFRHIAHVGPKTPSEIENIRNSDNVIDAVNEVSYYMKPSSSNNTLKSTTRSERVLLDDVFPASTPSKGSEVVRGYENQPTSHQYQNVQPIRPSRKTYKAPPPPTPPSQESKPRLISSEEEEVPVVFRSISKGSNPIVNLPSPKIYTPERIEPPKPSSVIIERPEQLGNLFFGLDDCIPITKQTPPLKTLSPIHRPFAVPKERQVETPILSPTKESEYVSTIRSTSAQGKQILEELDSWLDDLDDDDREKLSTISTDESGYPTLALEKDRAFMKHLVEKYELGVEPETIRLRRKKGPAPRLPTEVLSIPPFSSTRPVSMPPPNKPPPSYDTPSFDAPIYNPATNLINGKSLTKQNALDLRSSGEMSPAMARFLDDKRIKSATMPMSIGRMTTSSGFTDVSTTSSRSTAPSDDGIEDEVQPAPIPKPRTKKSISTEPLIEERENEKEEEEEEEKVIGEEFEIVESPKSEELAFPPKSIIIASSPLHSLEEVPVKKAWSEKSDSEEEDDDDAFIVTRF